MTNLEAMSDRDFDAHVSEYLFGWNRVPVPPDFDGQNAGEVLAPKEGMPRGFQLPPKGAIHVGFLCPSHSKDLVGAIQAANSKGIRFGHIPTDPRVIFKAVLAQIYPTSYE